MALSVGLCQGAEAKREALVFVGAHPDDSEGYAATAFLLKDRYDIHVVDLTRGELGLGRKGLDDGSTAKRRTAEERAACAKLGATPHFLHEIDGFACAGKPSVDALVRLIDELKPRAVFTHWPVDSHADHVQTAAVVANALRFARVRPERYFFEVMFSQTSNYRPLYRVNVSSTITNKLDMLSCYACQNNGNSLVNDNLKRAETRGRENGVACVETFTTHDGRRIEGGVLESLGGLCASEGPIASSTYVAKHPTRFLPLPTDREKAIAVFEENVYGRRPPLKDFPRTAKVLETREMPELGAVRKDILLNTLTPRGETNFLAVCYIPKAAKPVPAFVKMSLRPVTGFAPDPYAMGLYRKTEHPRVPLADILGRGFAVVMFHHASVFPDDASAFAGAERPADGWGAISTWALAASRCLDWIETEKAIDARRVAVIGHSRGGKTAIWAGVTDPRFALVISNDSGCSGARMSAVVSKPCERIADITRVFPYWFAPNYRTRWAGKDTELPFDHHQLLALVAPRLLAVGSAIDDEWACPQGEETALRFASRAWENPCAVHYHCRDGFHTLTPEDWAQYMDFAAANGWTERGR